MQVVACPSLMFILAVSPFIGRFTNKFIELLLFSFKISFVFFKKEAGRKWVTQ